MRRAKHEGEKHGYLTILHYDEYLRHGRWICQCDCGNITSVQYSAMLHGEIVSCGCHRSKRMSQYNYKHGLKNTRIYNIWALIKDRCLNVKSKDYKDYGQRGITLCEEWANDPTAFYNWAMNNGYDASKTIDRIDVNQGYSPDNCRWATTYQQNRNKRTNRYFTIDGDTKTLAEWCEIYNVDYNLVHQRISRGIDIITALTTPRRVRHRARSKEN